jgi:uncharacterized protein (TIGR02996 family)
VTTEDDFAAALDADPEDWQTRLVYADWLQERCDARAEGYRALGVRRRRPMHPPGNPVRFWWSTRGGGGPDYNHLSPDWFRALAGFDLSTDRWRWPRLPGAGDTRRAVEDAAALDFAKLPLERRAELLATPPGDAPTPPKPKKAPRKRPTARKPKRKKK